MNEAGEPIVNAFIQDVVSVAMTDDNGFFQDEINQETDSLVAQRGNQRCVSAFDNPRSSYMVVMLGTLFFR